ncbi:bacillithiol biosynthesis deacetylase BshB1 [Marivirga sp. S37H4]|uniref:Bacillithiol biosynthesis deacetylase BshB1 n=1 Tax=Marivirga aurantiaca TaxID=2802615 RepID=A0A935C681_9BACT|nr:bacillithiol biosynthesis deacetylase BshB1 [Marivirga aurantiaca]MBK6264220.1 bacillithiol biosynthesis deacetylase BshB1 [Marivirga aurantiaca]
MKLDLLAFAAHPDDTELSCAGTLALHASLGDKVGVIDFTEGEMGTRGTPALRRKEAEKSAEILGLHVRENLGFADSFFLNDKEHQMKVVRKIRQYKPDIILTTAINDRHPDHARASELSKNAIFLSGLKKVETFDDAGQPQEVWKPRLVLHYIQSLPIKPDIVVDVSDHWETKMKAVKAFESQFYNPESNEPETYISSPGFLKMIEARAMEFGHIIGVKRAEGFTVDKYLGVRNLKGLL